MSLYTKVQSKARLRREAAALKKSPFGRRLLKKAIDEVDGKTAFTELEEAALRTLHELHGSSSVRHEGHKLTLRDQIIAEIAVQADPSDELIPVIAWTVFYPFRKSPRKQAPQAQGLAVNIEQLEEDLSDALAEYF